jgi:hypothetical protein
MAKSNPYDHLGPDFRPVDVPTPPETYTSPEVDLSSKAATPATTDPTPVDAPAKA